MIIRLAQAADIPQLTALHPLLFTQSVWRAENWQKALSKQTTPVWVIMSSVGLVGFCAVQRITDEAEIQTIGIHPDHQRYGHACRLLGQVIKDLEEQSVARVFLEVEHSNTAAITLYEKLGFHELGERRDYYGRGRHALIMGREITLPPEGNEG